VPAQKFKEVENKQKTCAAELEMLKQKHEQLGVESTEMKSQLARNEKQLNSLIKDSMERIAMLEKLQADYDKVNGLYADLQQSQESILKGNARETARLLQQLQNAQDDLRKREDDLKKLEKAMDEKKRNLDRLTLEIEKRDARLSELSRILFRKDSAVNALKAQVQNALLGFDKEDLNVRLQNGKVYVSLEDKLLFKSGSIVVEKKGTEALKKLAKVLDDNAEINITIEGHTDNVPYKSNTTGMKDNWDLSVQRATSIIRILQESSNIDPKRLTASGRGEYYPIAKNETSEGKAKNRRTEIILTPRLDELFKILGNN
jgi:chemotaxis protein MotB